MAILALQPAFTSGELSPALAARVELAKYQQGCRVLRNFKVRPHGPAVKRPGFLLLDELPGPAALVRFVFNREQAYCLAFGEHWLRVFTHHGPVLDGQGRVYETETPYSLEQARQFSVAQSADVLFIASWGVPPQMLKRLNHDHWVFEPMSFDSPLPAPAAPTVSFVNQAVNSNGVPVMAQCTAPYTYFVTAVNKEGQESELSPGAEIKGPASNNWQGGDYIKIAWQPVEGAVEYRVYKSEFGGRAGFAAIAGETEDGFIFNDFNVTAALTESPPKYENPFPDGDYPGVVTFFEQRLVFASTPNRPQSLWMSKTGDFLNFAVYTPLTDDAPLLDLTVASPEVSSVCWLVSLRSLVMGTAGTEWEIKAAQEGAFTARNAKVTPQSYLGSSKLPAIIVGNTVLHVSRSGNQVRDFKYVFADDSYGGTDASILAAHLLETSRVVDWTYQQHPDSVVWSVREDGVLLGLTYQAEHEVFAWHRHDTDGAFRSVCSVPYGGHDSLFAAVERGGRFFMERMADQYLGGDYSRFCFLDCALVYDDPENPVAVVHGLEHLEGRKIGLLVDGAVQAPRVVRDGAVALDRPGRVVVAGLPYVADLETMPVEVSGQQGVSVGRKKQIAAVDILFQDTVGAKAAVRSGGREPIFWETVKWRQNEPHGAPPRPFSGFKSVAVRTLAENSASVSVRSDEPTPMTVVALLALIDIK